ncbi:DUF3800 domain-containing protein [Secundilactobacillus muriivasis]
MFYSLYLDESKFFDKTKQQMSYCIAGVVISNTQIHTVRKRMGILKTTIWATNDGYTIPKAKSIILHEAEIRSDNTKIVRKRPEYQAFHQNRRNKRLAIQEIGNIIHDERLTVLGAIENETSISMNYSVERDSYSAYYLCLKCIIENFCIFLKQHNGHGNIIFESRKNQSSDLQDQRTRKMFNKILANGTMIYSALELQKSLYTIKFIQKQENDAGLQIADFIPRPLLLNYTNTPQSKPSIYQTIRKARYTGIASKGQYASKFGVCIFE